MNKIKQNKKITAFKLFKSIFFIDSGYFSFSSKLKIIQLFHILPWNLNLDIQFANRTWTSNLQIKPDYFQFRGKCVFLKIFFLLPKNISHLDICSLKKKWFFKLKLNFKLHQNELTTLVLKKKVPIYSWDSSFWGIVSGSSLWGIVFGRSLWGIVSVS